jgi:Uncharacterized conserved protein
MKRREFFALPAAAALLAFGGCTTTGSRRGDPATRRRDIDSGVEGTLQRLYETVPGSREMAGRAKGILVFPEVIAAGFIVGGEYGEGALRVGDRTQAYYSTVTGSLGFQAGAQSKAVVFMFMTDEALQQFSRSNGWTAGADASVAVAKVGANGVIDTNTARGPVVGFVMTNAGLMANLNLEGTKVTRLDL